MEIMQRFLQQRRLSKLPKFNTTLLTPNKLVRMDGLLNEKLREYENIEATILRYLSLY